MKLTEDHEAKVAALLSEIRRLEGENAELRKRVEELDSNQERPDGGD